jgi:hypothetical protein
VPPNRRFPARASTAACCCCSRCRRITAGGDPRKIAAAAGLGPTPVHASAGRKSPPKLLISRQLYIIYIVGSAGGFRGRTARAGPTGCGCLPPPHRTVHAVVGIEIERAHRAGPAAVPSLSLRALPQAPNWSRFSKPPYDPGRSDFPSPVLASVLHAISQGGPSPTARNCGAGAPFAPTRWSLLRPFATTRPSKTQLSVWLPTDCRGHRVPRAPLPRAGVIRAGAASKAAWRGVTPSSSLIRAHAPDHPPPCASGVPVARRVFAGCRQSLLADGPSRHYLCDPCAGARTHTPPRSSTALVHSFTEDTGLTPRETGSARGENDGLSWPQYDGALGPVQVVVPTRIYPHMAASVGSRISWLQSFDHLRAPALARPPDCSDRSADALGRQAFHTTHRPAGYPDRDVASLHVRHGQLTWLDSHQLGRSLVGCSLPHTALRHRSPTGILPRLANGLLFW